MWLELAKPGVPRGPAFEAYCGQVARLREAQARVENEGLTVVDGRGATVPNPALEIERKAQAEVRAWGNEFEPRGRLLGRS